MHPARQAAAAVPSPVVALVASAGGLAALTEVLGALPEGFAAPVLVLQHLEGGRVSLLPRILDVRTPLRVTAPATGVRPAAGCVYVAPSDHHLTLHRDGTLHLDGGPPVNYSRPSADVLLGSLARLARCGVPVAAAILTGKGRDGARGALLLRGTGGTVLASDAVTSANFGMPGAAAEAGGVDEVLPLSAIGPRLLDLVSQLRYVYE